MLMHFDDKEYYTGSLVSSQCIFQRIMWIAWDPAQPAICVANLYLEHEMHSLRIILFFIHFCVTISVLHASQ